MLSRELPPSGKTREELSVASISEPVETSRSDSSTCDSSSLVDSVDSVELSVELSQELLYSDCSALDSEESQEELPEAVSCCCFFSASCSNSIARCLLSRSNLLFSRLSSSNSSCVLVDSWSVSRVGLSLPFSTLLCESFTEIRLLRLFPIGLTSASGEEVRCGALGGSCSFSIKLSRETSRCKALILLVTFFWSIFKSAFRFSSVWMTSTRLIGSFPSFPLSDPIHHPPSACIVITISSPFLNVNSVSSRASKSQEARTIATVVLLESTLSAG
mmetsp:Transcript_15877/g.20211  ORF Transcript_15877/g.20211 Transcript_15877/m.20211 type:complete len:274 (-) Transcript_15877:163-984(-)